MTDGKRSDGLILVSHPVHRAISPVEMLDALSPGLQHRPDVAIDLVKFAIDHGTTVDWHSAGRKTGDEIRAKLAPLVERHPSYDLAYFGAAPIPLALLAGFNVGTWTSVRVFQRRHDTHSWRWLEDAPPVSVPVSGVPSEITRARGDIVVCVQTSHRIDMQDVRAVVDHAVAEVTVSTDPIGPDALASESDVERVATEFTRVLDHLIERCPNVRDVHLFVAAPVGMTFRLGTCISSTKHHTVRVYFYSRHTEPRYACVFSLQDFMPAAVTLSDNDIARAANTRKVWDDERRRLASLGARLIEEGRDLGRWLRSVFPDLPEEQVPARIAQLPALSKVGLDAMQVQQQPCSHAEFRFNPATGEWELGDSLLAAIARRLPELDLPRAGRLFLLHEVLHEKTQILTSATSVRIGRFPKLLEEIDYLADLWAMVHECALARELDGEEVSSRQVILSCIDVALATFWAFDDRDGELEEIQVRRLHRYLIWTWQKLRLERAEDGDGAVFKILFDRPLLELAGPALIARGERVFFDLARRRFDEPEIAHLDRNRVRRHGDGPSTPVVKLLEGFRRRDSGRIRDALQGFFDQVRDDV